MSFPSRRRRAFFARACAIAGFAALSVAAPPARADIDATRNAVKFARAISNDPEDEIIGARFVKIPKSGNPVAISTTPLADFPTDGDEYGILSTGNATKAADANDSPDESTSNKGPVFRGARDVVMLRIDLNVREDSRCVSFGFRFLSEEFDEFIDSPYNDAFIAEIDKSTWSTGGDRKAAIEAPRSFARARDQRFISINQTGDFAVTEGRAGDSLYDAGTRRLRASERVKPGKHSLFLSIFDQADRLYDSAVFIDRLRIDDRKPCTSGTSIG